MVNEPDIFAGEIIEEEIEFTLLDLSKSCSVDTDWIILLVEEGIIEPIKGKETVHWRFSGTCLQRVRTAHRLQHDLGLNLAGIALTLDLLDEIEQLRQQLDHI